jgi:hypothetical protein
MRKPSAINRSAAISYEVSNTDNSQLSLPVREEGLGYRSFPPSDVEVMELEVRFLTATTGYGWFTCR